MSIATDTWREFQTRLHTIAPTFAPVLSINSDEVCIGCASGKTEGRTADRDMNGYAVLGTRQIELSSQAPGDPYGRESAATLDGAIDRQAPSFTSNRLGLRRMGKGANLYETNNAK